MWRELLGLGVFVGVVVGVSLILAVVAGHRFDQHVDEALGLLHDGDEVQP